MASNFSFTRRSSGLLLHPTSLPSRHGSGDLGPAAYRFADFLAAAGQRWWQMLPVGPPGMAPGYSPYSSTSALAGSPWLVSLDLLLKDGLLGRNDVEPAGGLDGKRVDYGASIRYREPRLRRAYDNFRARPRKVDEFEAFCRENTSWLEDFALFASLQKAFDGRPWDQWESGLRLRKRKALQHARQAHAEEIRFHQFVHWLFDRQWRQLKEYCNSRGVGLIGDIPIFVAFDSSDVWAHRELFLVDREGHATVVTGCPPDAFNANGQTWNHPHYRWQAHQREAFAWWVARFAACMQLFDGVRIDHFLGFNRAWAIPAGSCTAAGGRWLKGPGKGIFEAVRRELGPLPIIVEDLGAVTPEAVALREQFEFPGMRVLQLGFNGEAEHLPHNYVRGCAAYTGTHDNHTAAGWFRSLGRKSPERVKALEYLGATPEAISWDMIRAVMSSVANTAVFPVQDILGLGDEARMNVPGVDRGNWRWRLPDGALTEELAGELRKLAEYCDRV